MDDKLYAPPSTDLRSLMRMNRDLGLIYDEPSCGTYTYDGSIGFDMLTVKPANDMDEFWEDTLKLKQEG